jgi:hypothetical protein
VGRPTGQHAPRRPPFHPRPGPWDWPVHLGRRVARPALGTAVQYLRRAGTRPRRLRAWKWAGIGPVEAQATFDALSRELTAVRTPIGQSWILTRDEPAFRGPTHAADAVRLLPSGDAYFLLHSVDRELLVPDAASRLKLWTSRVWPGRCSSRGGRRHLATCSGEPDDAALASAHGSGTRRSRGGSGVAAPARHRGADRRSLGRLTHGPARPSRRASNRPVLIAAPAAVPISGVFRRRPASEFEVARPAVAL